MVNFPGEEIAIRALSFTLSDFVESENHARSTSEGAFLNERSPPVLFNEMLFGDSNQYPYIQLWTSDFLYKPNKLNDAVRGARNLELS